MGVLLAVWISLITVGVVAAGAKKLVKFADIISVIANKREVVSQHRFFKMLSDPTISYSKRMSFIAILQ